MIRCNVSVEELEEPVLGRFDGGDVTGLTGNS